MIIILYASTLKPQIGMFYDGLGFSSKGLLEEKAKSKILRKQQSDSSNVNKLYV